MAGVEVAGVQVGVTVAGVFVAGGEVAGGEVAGVEVAGVKVAGVEMETTGAGGLKPTGEGSFSLISYQSRPSSSVARGSVSISSTSISSADSPMTVSSLLACRGSRHGAGTGG